MTANAEALDESDDDLLDEEDDDDLDEERVDEVAPLLTVAPANVEPRDEEETLNDILTRAPRPGWKPNIAHLKDAIVDGSFMVPVGGKVLIQYPLEWQDTCVYKVCAINPENTLTQHGYVRLWDPNKMQYAATNYITGPGLGLVFKIPDEKRRWVPGEGEDMRSRRRRRRRRALVKDETPKPAPQLDANGNPVKKKRGRPKGSKNKSTLEREAKEQASKEST